MTDDSLAKTTPDYAAIGKAIIGKAEEQRQERAQDGVVVRVQRIIHDLAARRKDMAEYIENEQFEIDLQEKRLKAIEAGEFTLDILTGLHFNDDDLNGGGL
jgi:hypothetical protein